MSWSSDTIVSYICLHVCMCAQQLCLCMKQEPKDTSTTKWQQQWHHHGRNIQIISNNLCETVSGIYAKQYVPRKSQLTTTRTFVRHWKSQRREYNNTLLQSSDKDARSKLKIVCVCQGPGWLSLAAQSWFLSCHCCLFDSCAELYLQNNQIKNAKGTMTIDLTEKQA